MKRQKNTIMRGIRLGLAWAVLSICLTAQAMAAPGYEAAAKLGRSAGEQAKVLLEKGWTGTGAVVVTNAGYAMPEGHSTQGCLDGISEATGATVGASTLISLQARFDQPLWFGIYVPESGMCAYLEYDNASAAGVLAGKTTPVAAATSQVARIDADYLFAHEEEFSARMKEGLFGGNAFRLITTANAAAMGCDNEALRSIQVHDHFCPGVSSGVVLANYVRHNLVASPDTKVFVLTIKPWCKEDALTTLLNATPGKRSYGVLYPAKDQDADWPEALKKACTIFFTKTGDQPWRGHMLGFDFDRVRTACADKSFKNMVLSKLYMDIWFMENMDKAETMVEKLKEFELEPGKTPKDYLRPGTELIGMLKK